MRKLLLLLLLTIDSIGGFQSRLHSIGITEKVSSNRDLKIDNGKSIRRYSVDNAIEDELLRKEELSTYYNQFPGITLSQWKVLSALCDQIKEWNTKVNLVSRKDIDSLVSNHLIPSLSLYNTDYFKTSKHIIDIGSGGGFPGLPLAIVFPDKEFTLLDSSKKKTMVVSDIVNKLELKNVQIVSERAEKFEPTKLYDVILGRAVASIPDFLSFSAHLLNEDEVESNSNRGILYIKGGDFLKELDSMGINRKNCLLLPIQELVQELSDNDKYALFIPSQEIIHYKKNKHYPYRKFRVFGK